jgi:hypothetical protein
VPNSIYLVNPRENAPGAHSAEVLRAWGVTKVDIGMADLSTATVAALVPPDWTVSLCDERLQPVDFDTGADVVGLTGKISQRDRMVVLAAEFRRRGKLVVIGGPHASLDPDDVRPHADILVIGEIEEIAAKIFADIAAGDWQPEYKGTRPDLNLSPIPRWDLYPRHLAVRAQVQTSRGCPFECEFCDVIQYLGRKQRWKDPERIIAELEVLYEYGFRSVFLADDNFTVFRKRTRALLERLAEWNRTRPNGRVSFSTQVSIDLARDPELLHLCVEAGMVDVFIGIETPNEESLAETLKRQNLRIDLAEEVRKVVRTGMSVKAGIMVGFDHDGPDIFARQIAFIQSLPVPSINLGVVFAPAATPLHARMKEQGRLVPVSRTGGGIVQTNIRPVLMSERELKDGMIWLFNRVFAASAFAHRVEAFAALYPQREATRRGANYFRALPLARRLAKFGRADEHDLLARMEALAFERPELRDHLIEFLLYYCQMRYRLEQEGIWDPSLAELEAPLAA